jgi:hypothetical protein
VGYRFLGDAVAGVHYAYLVYLVIGGFIAWRWPRTIALHGIAAAWGFAVVAANWPCPLTAVQNMFRESGGEPRLQTGFNETYVTGTLYPADYQVQTRAVIAAVVAISWLGVVVIQRRRRRISSGGSAAPMGHGPARGSG